MSRLRQRSATAGLQLLFVLFVLSAALLPVRADSTEEAEVWLEKMVESYTKGPIKASFEMTIMAPTGETGPDGVQAQGTMIFDGNSRSRMNLEMTVNMPQMGGEMTMGMLQIFDGQNIWMEMESPMMPGKMVMKSTKEKMEQMKQMGGGLGGSDIGTPFGPEQMEEMKVLFDWSLLEVANGRATLQAVPNEEGIKALTGKDGEMDIPEGTKMVMVIDAGTALPIEMRMGEMVSMKMHDVERLEALPADAFDYTPPEGATVMDLGQMMGGR